MIRIGFLALILFLSNLTAAQMNRDLFPLSREYKKGGFYITPQGTYSIGYGGEGSFSIVDTTYSYNLSGNGQIGYGIEGGWFHNFQNNHIVDFIEGGLAYRMFRGKTVHDGDWYVNDNKVLNVLSNNTFKIQTLVATVRAIKVKQLGSYSFFTYGAGVNFNYVLSSSYQREKAYPNVEETFLNQTSAQLHIQLGFGLKFTDKLLVIPTIETPIITGYPTAELVNPSFPFFKRRYQPIIVGIKFMFLRSDNPLDCNTPKIS